MNLPGDRKDGRSLFLSYTANNCLLPTRKPKGVIDLDLYDVEAIEAAEASLNQFIERRAKQSEEQRRVEEEWLISERRYRARRRERNRELWRSWHLGQAERLERTAAELATGHRAKAAALAEDGAEW